MTLDAIDSFAAGNSGAEYRFLPAYLYAVEQFKKKNNLPMYRLTAYINGLDYKGAKINPLQDVGADGETKRVKVRQYVKPLKALNQHCLPGVAIKHNAKTGKMSVEMGGNAGVSDEKVRVLAETLGFYRNKVTVNSEWFKAQFPVEKPEPVWNPVKRAESLSKSLTRKQCIELIAALQEQVK